ncbi:MAG: hypothetical protein WC498_00505 [Candidatus Saccharimonadales bacterium]
MFRRNKVKVPKVPKAEQRTRLPKGSVWVSVKAFTVTAIVFMLGEQYNAAVATGQVHRTRPVIVGTLILAAGVVMAISLAKYIGRDIKSSGSDKWPKKGLATAAGLITAVLWVGYHVVKDNTSSGVPWNEATAQAGTAAGLTIVVLALFVWSLFHAKSPKTKRVALTPAEEHYDEQHAEHETGPLGFHFAEA